MGSFIELNDTLQITTEQGFPEALRLEKHLKTLLAAQDFVGQVFCFEKPGLRIYHPAPTPVRLVHNIDGRWLYWGHVNIIEQTMHAKEKITTGKFIITKIYLPEHQRNMSMYDVDAGKEFKFI